MLKVLAALFRFFAMFAFLTLLVLLKSEASGIWTRVHNLIWLGEPGRNQAELEQEFEQRWTEVIDNMNIMLEFHEVPARLIKGQMIAMDTALWELVNQFQNLIE